MCVIHIKMKFVCESCCRQKCDGRRERKEMTILKLDVHGQCVSSVENGKICYFPVFLFGSYEMEKCAIQWTNAVHMMQGVISLKIHHMWPISCSPLIHSLEYKHNLSSVRIGYFEIFFFPSIFCIGGKKSRSDFVNRKYVKKKSNQNEWIEAKNSLVRRHHEVNATKMEQVNGNAWLEYEQICQYSHRWTYMQNYYPTNVCMING